MSFYFSGDQSTIQRLQARDTADQYRATVDVQPDFVTLLSQYAQLYPDMQAGVMVPLA